MARFTKNKIGICIILAAMVCLISFPRLALAASAQLTNYQTPQQPFHSMVTNPDFSIYVIPSYLSITAGGSMNTTVLVMSRYNFNGTVSLSASVPAGWTTTFTQSSLSLANGYYGYYYGSYNWSTLSVAVPSGTAAGKYTVVVTGTNGSLTHSANVTVNVVAPDFWMYAFPSYLSATAGTTANSTILLTSLYGFSGTVSLATSVPAGWAASPVPSSLSVMAGYFNGSALSIAVPSGATAGKYTITVTGTSGSLTHSANVTVNVVTPDFWINAFPPHLWVTAGSTANSTVVLSSLYGFSGTVSLTASVPSGWTGSLVPSSLSVKNRYFNCSALSIAVPSDAAAGKYTITVTGTSGSLTHSANVTVNVVSSEFGIKP